MLFYILTLTFKWYNYGFKEGMARRSRN